MGKTPERHPTMTHTTTTPAAFSPADGITTVNQLERAVAAHTDNTYFGKAERRYFGSRFGSTVYGARYFVESQQDRNGVVYDGARRYFVQAFTFTPYTDDEGFARFSVSIDSVDVQPADGFSTAADAIKRAKLLTSQNEAFGGLLADMYA